MERQTAESLFKKSSTTYFVSSLFFPEHIKNEVFTLYAFVRTADNFVDAVPQQKNEFLTFVDQYHQALIEPCGDSIIDNFVELSIYRNIPVRWVDAFLAAMKLDLFKARYESIEQTNTYMYGSAEVIGLMLCKIMSLPVASYDSARLLGRAMQYCNMIRDIDEDCQLGRQYIPDSSLRKFGLKTLSRTEAFKNPDKFSALVTQELQRYYNWNNVAKRGLVHIPKRLRVPIATATEMYHWAAKEIEKDPMIVWEKKVKPTKLRIVKTAARFIMQ